jgi:uncharacterized protein (DUF608 family)
MTGEIKLAKVLHGDLHPHYIGNGDRKFHGFGFGVERESLAGFPHFEKTEFKGEFPFAEISFMDAESPLNAKLVAFNPFIPLNDRDSSLPVAIFTFEVTNRSDEELFVSLVGNLTNPFAKGSVNRFQDFGTFRGIKLYSVAYAEDDPQFGDLFLSTDCEDVSYQTFWYRGGWFDNLTVFWKDFNTPGRFQDRVYEIARNHESATTYNYKDVCLLSGHQTLSPGETGVFRFIISWNFPNFTNYWNPGSCGCGDGCHLPSWKNHYAVQFADSTHSAAYTWQRLPRLERETAEFKESLFRSTLPDYVLDAVASNLSVLKSPTCVRLTDGTLYGFEGCHAHEGCCEGSCTHVWNYEQATPFLFPSLARSMRNIEYRAAQFPNGKMAFRLMLPAERTLTDLSDCAGPERAAADGQMGCIVRTYREWKICGDTQWLRSIWPKVKKALEYAWEPSNPDGWDRDADGVMEGIQHHTLDVEMYGPNAYITGLYHAALLAAAHMAETLGDPASAKYRRLYEAGAKWVDEHLFNGEYFIQKIDLKDSRFPVDPELGEVKYQVGEGCHIDQVLGQWHAHIAGLGYLFDKDKVESALKSIFKYNFKSMREHANACRIFALNDEEGLLICTWPKGGSPQVPVPYADECMTGFEYQAACHMIYEGLIEEGLTVVKAVRDRYDGEKRNPWNEIECGSNYVRSMASYALLPALSGFEYDMNRGHIGFCPKINREKFRAFWSLHRGWGEFVHENGQIELAVKFGELELKSFRTDLLTDRTIGEVYVGEEKTAFAQNADTILFGEQVRLNANRPLRIVLKTA